MIHGANGWAFEVLDAIWRASWQGGLFVLAIWIATKAFHKMPSWAKHWLWWVACLQMAVRMFVSISVPVLPAAEVLDDPIIVSSPAPITYAVQQHLSTSLAVSPPAFPAPSPAPEGPSLQFVLVSAWILGCSVSLAISGKHLFALRKLMRGSQPPDSGTALLVGSLAQDMNLKAPRVRISSDAPCPMLAGWLRPTIILPEWAGELSEAELQLALRHELLHLQRRDLWLALVPALVKCLYFFHPLVWLATHETSLACEETCDIETLSLGIGSPAAYARLLLHSAQTKTSTVALGTAFGFRSLQRRITMLKRLNLSAPARRTRSLTIFIALAAVCALPWNVTAQPTKRTTKHRYARRHAHRVVKKQKSAVVLLDGGLSSLNTRVGTKIMILTDSPKDAIPESATIAPDGQIMVLPDNQGQNGAMVTTDKRTFTLVGPGISGGKIEKTKNLKVVQLDGHRDYFLDGVQVKAAPSGMGGGGFAVAPAAPSGLGGGGLTISPAPHRGAPSGMGGGGFGITAPQGGFGGGGGIEAPAPLGRRGGTRITIQAPQAEGIGGGSGIDTGLDVDAINESNITARFKNVNLREALTELFNAAKVNYTIKSSVSYNNVVTCGFNHASLQDILRAMLDSVDQALTYRVDGGTYIISAKDSAPERAGN